MEVLCEQAEALAKLDDSELEDAQGRMQGLTSEWLAQNQRPGRLVQRFDKAQARFSERIEQLHERARQQAEQALASRAAQIQQLWEKRLAGEPIAVDSAGAGDSRPESELEQKLVAVTDRIADPESSVDALTETTEQNAELARQVVVEMEFLAGMDSPADDQKRRMDYQVKRLASRLGDRSQQPDLATELASLQHRWLTSLPHPPKIHSELAKRFEKCQTVVQKNDGTLMTITLPGRIAAVFLFMLAAPAVASEGAEAAAHFGLVSVLPPLLAIGLALWLRQIIPALFIGIWVGAWALNDFTLAGLGMGLLEAFQVYLVTALADRDHASVILFTAMIGGMVGLITRNGGLAGVVELIVDFADSVRRASIATVALGFCDLLR